MTRAMTVAAMFVIAGCTPDLCDAGPGTICTFAGTGESAFNGDGHKPLETDFYWPMKVRFDPSGTPYVLDWNNHRVRRLTSAGVFETVIGNDNIGDGPDGASDLVAPGVAGIEVNLNHPTDIVFRADGSAILASWHNHKLRNFDPVTGLVHVLTGRGPDYGGDGGPASEALLNQPKALEHAANGDLYFVDQRNQRIRRIRASDGIIETVAGNGVKGFAGDGGPPTSASISMPTGGNPQPGGALAFDTQGRLYLADTENHRIRRIDFTANVIETIAGDGQQRFAGDGGPATAASFRFPRDLAIAPNGLLYVADTENNAVREIDLATGLIRSVAGDGSQGFSGDGAEASAAKLARPYGVTTDADGNLYIADTFNGRVRKISAGAN